MVRKCSWLEQSTLTPSTDWSSIRTWLFQLIGGSQQLFHQCFTNKCYQKYEFYNRKGYRKSNAIQIIAIVSPTLSWPLYALFSYHSTLYRLEVMSQYCNNLSYIFIHTYYYCQATIANDHYMLCFLITPPYIDLRWCPNTVIIFLIYLYIHITTVKQP